MINPIISTLTSFGDAKVLLRELKKFKYTDSVFGDDVALTILWKMRYYVDIPNDIYYVLVSIYKYTYKPRPSLQYKVVPETDLTEIRQKVMDNFDGVDSEENSETMEFLEHKTLKIGDIYALQTFNKNILDFERYPVKEYEI